MNREYFRVHGEIRSKRGKADTYLCVDCDADAKDWSHIHDTNPSDVMNYEPRCKSCHMKYDYNDAWKEKLSIAKLGNTNSIGNSNRLGHKNSAEHNAKLSATRIAKYGIAEEIIVCVRAMHKSGKSQIAIANHFNISTMSVGRIIRRERRFADA